MKTQTKNYKKERNLFIASMIVFTTVVGYVVYNSVVTQIINGSSYVSGF